MVNQTVSRGKLLLSKAESAQDVTTIEAIPDALTKESGGHGSITHTRPQKFDMFKHGPYGWRRVAIPANSVGQALSNGLRAECGDCGSPDCRGYLYCSALPPMTRRRCPVCARIIPDAPTGQADIEAETEPGEIIDEQFTQATPEERTRVRLAMHIQTFHPQEGPNYGLPGPELRAPQAVPVTPNWPQMVPDNPARSV